MAFQAELFKKKLKEEGKGRDEIAAAVGKDKRTVSRWLAGTNAPKSKDLETIARTLNCRPQDFDPFFAEKGLGEVSIQAHVSVASHNAYELMRWRYDVSQKQIMELAPVLFSIVAGLALKVPDQDDEIARLAHRNGLGHLGFHTDHLDRQASERGKCFGIETDDPEAETPRNLFNEAILRLSAQIPDYVDAKWFVGAAPEEAPNVAGYIADIELVEILAGGQPQLAEAISKGRIRLSSVLQQAKEDKGDDISVEEFAEAIKNAQDQGIAVQRKVGLKKWKAWRAFYAERHPELAKEFDDLVACHCHEEGWYPDGYTADDRVQSLVNPFEEDLHVNEDTLVEYQRQKSDNLALPQLDPTYRRLEELKRHRSSLKKQFEEVWA